MVEAGLAGAFLTGPSYIWLLTAVFLLYRSYRRFRRARLYRAVLTEAKKNGVFLIAANGNVRRAVYGIAVALVAIGLTALAAFSEPSALRGAVLAGGVIAILGIYALSGVRDDVDTDRMLRYGTDEGGHALALESTLVEVQGDVAAVSEKVGVAAEAAAAAREEANKVHQKIAVLTERADVSEHRADDAEAREDSR